MSHINKLFKEFETYHTNPTNIKLHLICIPAILYSFLGIFHTILKYSSLNLNTELLIYTTFVTPGLVFLFKCSLVLTLELILISLPVVLFYFLTIPSFELQSLLLFIFIFVIGWFGQLWGHKLENKRPAFTKDFIFLFVGPLWVLNFLNKKIILLVKS